MSVRVLVQIPGGYQMMITDIQIPVPTHRPQTDHRPGPGQLNSAIKILAAHIVSPAQPSPAQAAPFQFISDTMFPDIRSRIFHGTNMNILRNQGSQFVGQHPLSNP